MAHTKALFPEVLQVQLLRHLLVLALVLDSLLGSLVAVLVDLLQVALTFN